MSDYRVFPLGGDGFIDWGRQQHAQTNAEAIGLASGLLDRHAVVEVWHSGKCVARLDGGLQQAGEVG